MMGRRALPTHPVTAGRTVPRQWPSWRGRGYLLMPGVNEALKRMGQKNTNADHAKECRNSLGHRNRPLNPATTKRHGRPNSQKKSKSCNHFARSLRIYGNTECRKSGEPPAGPAFGRRDPGGNPVSFGDRNPSSYLQQEAPILSSRPTHRTPKPATAPGRPTTFRIPKR
jgi:hypothetical protein